VTLNGASRLDPEAPVNLEKDRIEVNGKRITAETKLYFVLNKPHGVVTTASDEKGRQTVYQTLGENVSWVAPVGRLDKASEGLLLMTNDSEWAARILAPETHLNKTYHVRLGAPVDQKILDCLVKGIKTAEGDVLRAKEARILRGGERRTWVEIVLDEGKNRQIRRMFEQLGIEVLRLVRTAIGPLTLGDLPKGNSRPLTPAEKKALDDAMQG
jgi:23S rRNA pseudouridine2605 synthase